MLRGTFRHDEPLPPYRFLLSPEVLSTASAESTVLALDRASASVPEATLLSLVKRVLGDEPLRRKLKISVHRALLRVVEGCSGGGPALVLQEWGRRYVHRDIRVAILRTALVLLGRSADASSPTHADLAWTVLGGAATDPEIDPLVKASLLSVRPWRAVGDVKLRQWLAASPTAVLGAGTADAACRALNAQREAGLTSAQAKDASAKDAAGAAAQRLSSDAMDAAWFDRVVMGMLAAEDAARPALVEAAERAAEAVEAATKSQRKRAVQDASAARERLACCDHLRAMCLLDAPRWAAVVSAEAQARAQAVAQAVLADVDAFAGTAAETEKRDALLLADLARIFVATAIAADSRTEQGAAGGGAVGRLLGQLAARLGSLDRLDPAAGPRRAAALARMSCVVDAVMLESRRHEDWTKRRQDSGGGGPGRKALLKAVFAAMQPLGDALIRESAAVKQLETAWSSLRRSGICGKR
jgi:hypothetical protein